MRSGGKLGGDRRTGKRRNQHSTTLTARPPSDVSL
jgi:hypothetical protein